MEPSGIRQQRCSSNHGYRDLKPAPSESIAPPTARSDTRQLVRAIGRGDLTAFCINAIIGAGIFGLPAVAYARVGNWSLLAFGVCGLVVMLLVLCFAEVSSRFEATGGPYLYARTAFGPLAGFEVGWLLYIARLTAFAANINLLVSYVAWFWPSASSTGWREAIIATVVIGLTTINLLGIKGSTLLSNLLTYGKLIPLALLIGLGLLAMDRPVTPTLPLPKLPEFSASVLLLIYAFSGFEVAAIMGGELKDPRRDLPKALLTALGVVISFYVLLQLVAISTVADLGNSERPLTDAAMAIIGPLGAAVISTGAIISILGNLHTTSLVAPRLPFAMAERKELPGFLSEIHPTFHTPHRAILITATLLLIIALSGTFVYAATVSVIARLLTYGVTCAALPVFRRRRDLPEALFRLPAGNWIVAIALGVSGWLLTHTSGQEMRDTTLAALAGMALYGLSRWRYRSA